MRKPFARIVVGVLLAVALFGMLGGGASDASTGCQHLRMLGYLCLTQPPDGVEVFHTNDPWTFSNVTGVGLHCFGGQYYAQYQLGDPSSYRPVALVKVGDTCPLFN